MATKRNGTISWRASMVPFSDRQFERHEIRARRCVCCLALMMMMICGGGVFLARVQGAANGLFPVSRRGLCITEGEISESAEKMLAVNAPKMRAYVNGTTIPEAEVRFTYLGATDKDVPLGSGEMRRQFGLKLLAADACNLVYVMWRIEPESKVVVSVKSNTGQHTSAECGNRGYRNIKARKASAISAVKVGSTHTLQAALRGEELRVLADGAAVWEGSVGTEAIRLQGPVGVRSDNARLTFTLRAQLVGDGRESRLAGCRVEAGE